MTLLSFYWAILTGKVQKANISVTDRCNLKCRTCHIWQKPQTEEMSVSDYEPFFKEHSDLNWISFTGGEPFLRTDLEEIVQAAHDNCKALHTVSFPTNGYLTAWIVDSVDRILDIGIPSVYVSVSLDGSESFHDLNRGVTGTWRNANRTFDKLRELRRYGFKVHFEYTISKFNQGNLQSTIESSKRSVNDFIINIAQKSSFYYDNALVDVEPQDPLLVKDLAWFYQHYHVGSVHDLAQWFFLVYAILQNPIPCVAGKNSFYMDPQGKMYPCTLRQQKTESCKCYTPCESYLALLLNRKSLIATLLRG